MGQINGPDLSLSMATTTLNALTGTGIVSHTKVAQLLARMWAEQSVELQRMRQSAAMAVRAYVEKRDLYTGLTAQYAQAAQQVTTLRAQALAAEQNAANDRLLIETLRLRVRELEDLAGENENVCRKTH